MTNLEQAFQNILLSTFEKLRSDYHYHDFTKEEAEQLQKMLEDKLGMPDPEGAIPEEAWRRSNWCSGG